MARSGLDTLVVPSPENMYYLAGYDGWSFYLHQCLIVSRHAQRVIWVGRGSDLEVARHLAVIGEGDAFTYPDACLHSESRHPYDVVAQVLREAGWGSGVLGVPMDAYYFSPAAYFALQSGLPDARLVPDGGLPNWQRIIKSPDEIALMREAARIGAAALEAGAARVRAGSPTSATAAAILEAQTGAGIGADGGYPAIMPLIIDGNGPARPHDTWSAAPHPARGPCVLEIAGVHHRYHAPMARTVFIGKPDPLHIRALDAQIACMETVERVAHAGRTAGEVADLLSGVLAGRGFSKSGRFGYSTGIAYPPDWGEHTLSIRQGETARLEEGMTLFFIPGLWGGEWSVVLGETFVVGATSAQRLGTLPYQSKKFYIEL
jgi:Xaa-Pro aminopeptidase